MGRVVPLVLTASLLALVARPARACDVPVFQYALEHWQPDPYTMVVLHRGPMDAASQTLVASLEKEASHGNCVVQVIDAEHSADYSESEFFPSRLCEDGPRLVVRFPAASRLQGPAWEGRLTANAVAAVTDSPCRREIARRLLAGDATVWVLLQTGRKEVDDAAAARVQEELKRPAGEGQPPLPCSLVRVTRGDATEALLVETLLSSEPDLHDRDQPMAFPVFGRGRVLYALVGAGIKAETVRHALDFLVGGCSCTVKRLNPGVDLLLNADWSVIAPTTPEEPAALPSEELVPLTPLPSHIAPKAVPSAAAVPSDGLNVWLLGGAGAAAILAAATGWLALRSGKRRSVQR